VQAKKPAAVANIPSNISDRQLALSSNTLSSNTLSSNRLLDMADRAPYKMRPVILRPSIGCCGRLSRGVSGLVFLFLWALQAISSTSSPALPKRLILAIDGVAYRDMKALQEGVTYKDAKGRQFHRDRKSTRLNSSHLGISYAVFCLN